MKTFVLAGLGCLVCLNARAQAPAAPPLHVTVVSSEPTRLTVRTATGESMMAAITPTTRIEILTPRGMSDLKPGVYIGSGAVTAADGTLHAQEVHTFPSAGIGEGHRQMGSDPSHTMTNATISKVTPGAAGETLQLDYKGGSQQIVVGADTAIVGIRPGSAADLRPGMAITLMARPGAGGQQTAMVIMAGKDGAKPPL